MPIISKPYTFTNGSVADATQVDSDFDTLFNAVNGNLDSANIAPGGVATANLAPEAVTPTKTEGLVYASDMFGSSFVVSGLVVTKDGGSSNQVDVTAGVVYISQSNGTFRRLSVAATTFQTVSTSATYYLDLNPDGTFSFATGHSSQFGYLNLATVTTDASANITTFTTTASSYAVTLVNGVSDNPLSVTSVGMWIGNF